MASRPFNVIHSSILKAAGRFKKVIKQEVNVDDCDHQGGLNCRGREQPTKDVSTLITTQPDGDNKTNCIPEFRVVRNVGDEKPER